MKPRPVIGNLSAIHRQAVQEAITAYALAAAGTRDDLDPELEAASLEHLADTLD